MGDKFTLSCLRNLEIDLAENVLPICLIVNFRNLSKKSTFLILFFDIISLITMEW